MLADMTAELLEDCGCEVVGPVATVRAAREAVETERLDLALVDRRLPDGDGIEVIEVLVERGIRCAVLSASTRPAEPRGVLRDVEWIEKPISMDRVRQMLRKDGREPECRE